MNTGDAIITNSISLFIGAFGNFVESWLFSRFYCDFALASQLFRYHRPFELPR